MIKICISPGHGGIDRANRGVNGYIEADGVLVISKHLKEILESTGRFSVFLTRDRDMTLTLTQRGKFAVDYGADLFISEHTDAGGGSGTTVFYSVDIPNDKVLAAKFSKAISSAFGIPDRGPKTKESEKYPGEDYYTEIDVAQDGGVPHVILIESMFHDNLNEEKILLDPLNLRKIAEIQAGVICDFYGVKMAAPVVESRLAWKEIIQKSASSPELWEKGIETAVALTKMDNNMGDLEVFKFLPALIEKVYHSK